MTIKMAAFCWHWVYKHCLESICNFIIWVCTVPFV